LSYKRVLVKAPPSSRLLAILLIAFSILAYLPVIRAGYIWDDDALLTANPLVRDPHGLAQIWQGKNSRDYTPLTTTVFRAEWSLWADTPAAYHIVNILLHTLSALLFWQILKTLRIPGAWLGALLFAIHPVNVASVAWIAELKNTLSAALFFASIFAYLRAEERDPSAPSGPLAPWGLSAPYIVSLVFFALAALAKGAVVTLPGVLLLIIWWANWKITLRDLAKLAPFVLIACIAAWLTIHYQVRAENYHLIPEDLAYRIARAGHATWWYLGQIVLPIHISPIAPQWVPEYMYGVLVASAYVPGLAMAALLFIYVVCWKSLGRPLFFAFACYLWMLLPVLGVFAWLTLQQETPAADWWQYLAAPAIFALVGAGFATALNRIGENKKAATFAIQIALRAIILLLLAQTWRRDATYRSMETYCAAVVSEVPGAWTLQNNLGIIFKQNGDYPTAIAHYRQSLAANPKFVEAHNNLANALTAIGDLPAAEAEYLEALKLRPQSADLTASLAETYFREEGKIREAIATQAAALKLDRTNPQRYVRFGLMLAANNQHAQAIVCYKNAIVLDPRQSDPRTPRHRPARGSRRRLPRSIGHRPKVRRPKIHPDPPVPVETNHGRSIAITPPGTAIDR